MFDFGGFINSSGTRGSFSSGAGSLTRYCLQLFDSVKLCQMELGKWYKNTKSQRGRGGGHSKLRNSENTWRHERDSKQSGSLIRLHI